MLNRYHASCLMSLLRSFRGDPERVGENILTPNDIKLSPLVEAFRNVFAPEEVCASVHVHIFCWLTHSMLILNSM